MDDLFRLTVHDPAWTVHGNAMSRVWMYDTMDAAIIEVSHTWETSDIRHATPGLRRKVKEAAASVADSALEVSRL